MKPNANRYRAYTAAKRFKKDRYPTQHLHSVAVRHHPEGAFKTGVVRADEKPDEQMVDADGYYHRTMLKMKVEATLVSNPLP
jgi:hypothetical protein